MGIAACNKFYHRGALKTTLSYSVFWKQYVEVSSTVPKEYLLFILNKSKFFVVVKKALLYFKIVIIYHRNQEKIFIK